MERRLKLKLKIITTLLILPLQLGSFLFAYNSLAALLPVEMLSSELSGNGSVVVFTSLVNLVSGDSNKLEDIFIRHTSDGKIELMSRGKNNSPANGASFLPSISADGRFVSFSSTATNIIDEDDDKSSDVFLYDRSDNTTELISGLLVNTETGISKVSDDGNIVAFSAQSNSKASSGVFIYNRATEQFKKIADQELFTNPQGSLAMSGSGRYIVFLSSSSVVAGDSNGARDAFLYDNTTGSVRLVSVGTGNAQANSDTNYVDVSNDGNLIVWSSAASNLVLNDDNAKEDIFIYDVRTQTTSRVVESLKNSGNTGSIHPRISADGSAIVFESKSDFINRGEAIANNMVYRYGFVDGMITRMSNDQSGNPSTVPAEYPSVSDNGLLVIFSSGGSIFTFEDNQGPVLASDFSGSPVEPLPISTTVATTSLFANLGILMLLRPLLSSSNFFAGFQNGSFVARISNFWSSLSSYQLYYYSHFLNFLSLIGLRKKRKVWGTVYDSDNKQPLDPAVVELIDKSGKVIEQSITDLAGRFGFIATQGVYTLRASKTNYIFPSQTRLGTNDEFYDHLYHGETLKITDKSSLVNPNIPMDPTGVDWNQVEKQRLFHSHARFMHVLNIISKMLFWFGFGFSVVNYFLHPNIWSIVAVAAYVVILIFKLIAVERRLWGKVVLYGNPPEEPVKLELTELQMGVVMGKALTAPDGKFFLKAPQQGEYKLTVKYAKSGKVLWTGMVKVNKNCVMNEDIILPKK